MNYYTVTKYPMMMLMFSIIIIQCVLCAHVVHIINMHQKRGRTHFVYHVATLLIITHTTIGFYLKMDPDPNPNII